MRKYFFAGLILLSIVLSSCNTKPPAPAEPTAVELNSFQVIPPKVTEKDYLEFDDSKLNIGIYLDQPDDIRSMEVKPDIVGWFEDWQSKAAKLKIELFGSEHISIPMMTWMPKDVPLEEIVNGERDEYIKGYLRRLAIACPENDILIRFAHEMEFRPSYETTWYSWQEPKDPDLYKKAWIHVVELGRQYNPNIKWVWSPNRSDEYSSAYYPGDEYVDYVGLTLNLPETNTSDHNTFRDFYVNEGTKEHLEKYNKKVIISEVAYSGGNEENKLAYLKSVFEYAQSDPNIAAVLFFNDNISENQLYRITDNEKYMQLIFEEIRKLRNE